jgi:hypothetical protein
MNMTDQTLIESRQCSKCAENEAINAALVAENERLSADKWVLEREVDRLRNLINSFCENANLLIERSK